MFVRLFGFGSVVALCGELLAVAPASAMGDACHRSKEERPAYCPADDRIASLGQEVRENNVFFPQGGARLDGDATVQISLLAKVLSTQQMAGTCLKLVGHSDSVGGRSVNEALSERRAAAVRDALEDELGARTPPIEIAGMGEDDHLGSIPSDHVGQRRVTLWAKRCS